MSEPKPMVIEISSASDLSNVTIKPMCPIEEDIESPEVQQPKKELELEAMAQPRKPLVPTIGLAPVPPPG